MNTKKYNRITEQEFVALNKKKMKEVLSVCDGHKKSIIWLAEGKGYCTQIIFNDLPDVYVLTACTFTPSFGIDNLDGKLIEEAEAQVVKDVLGK